MKYYITGVVELDGQEFILYPKDKDGYTLHWSNGSYIKHSYIRMDKANLRRWLASKVGSSPLVRFKQTWKKHPQIEYFEMRVPPTCIRIHEVGNKLAKGCVHRADGKTLYEFWGADLLDFLPEIYTARELVNVL